MYGPLSFVAIMATALNDRYGSRPCENDFADHLDARLIHAVHHARIKDSPKPLLRFYYCALTATLSVFTQPGSIPAVP